MTITLADQIRCVQREIAMRERVYPKWVKDGRMPSTKAADELAAMKAVRATLLELEQAREPQRDLPIRSAPVSLTGRQS